jgi:predicted component of type VI protein secretion system
MYMIQLFEGSEDVRPVDARRLRHGLLRIGRDSAADWPITDADCELSRAHLELEADDDGLRLKALGTNGVFDDTTGARFPDPSAG